MKAIDAVREYIERNESAHKTDIANFLIQKFPGISSSSINWKIHNLLKDSTIASTGRGIYIATRNKDFRPDISDLMSKTGNFMNENFPELEYTIWDTRIMNDFTTHQIARYSVILEVERGAEESIFNFLVDIFSDVFLSPTKKEYQLYVSNKEYPVIIKPLISQSPKMKISGIKVPKLEKILVDLIVDHALFTPFQGNEMVTIFRNAFTTYNINVNTLKRYAGRRGAKGKLTTFLDNFHIANHLR